jgi:hypothetical protein
MRDCYRNKEMLRAASWLHALSKSSRQSKKLPFFFRLIVLVSHCNHQFTCHTGYT